MKYSEAVKKLFEVMDAIPEITKVKFNREEDSIDIISGDNIHVCFRYEDNKPINKYIIGDKVKTKIHFNNDPRTTVEAIICGIELINTNNTIRYKIKLSDDCNGGTSTGYVYEDDIIELLS